MTTRPMIRCTRFGVCPQCSASPVVRNIGPDHYGCCDQCKVCWHIGHDMFGMWKKEPPAVWKTNGLLLETYTYDDCGRAHEVGLRSVEQMRNTFLSFGDLTRVSVSLDPGERVESTLDDALADLWETTQRIEDYWRDLDDRGMWVQAMHQHEASEGH